MVDSVRPKALAIVGNEGATNVGESLRRAAISAGYQVHLFNSFEAAGGSRVIRALSWRVDRKPPHLSWFSNMVVERCARSTLDFLIATGAAPLTAEALRRLRAAGITCVNYSTDDPWNPNLQASWYLRALPEYAAVFTTRRANIGDFRNLGCGEVHYLQFGYDEWLWCRPSYDADGIAPEVLFVGGADRDRVAFMIEFMRGGPAIAFVGDYWERYPAMRARSLGHRPPDAVRALTKAARINLCLVRRANRDGHVMRSFEIAALGGCMLTEDTMEHRDVFGPDGETVVYFRTPAEAAERARALLADPGERVRLSKAVQARILSGAHTYRDRLRYIVDVTTRIDSWVWPQTRKDCECGG
jgi:hypothetical protein